MGQALGLAEVEGLALGLVEEQALGLVVVLAPEQVGVWGQAPVAGLVEVQGLAGVQARVRVRGQGLAVAQVVERELVAVWGQALAQVRAQALVEVRVKEQG